MHNGGHPPSHWHAPRSMPHFDPPAFARHGLVTAAFSCLIALALTLSGRGAWDVQLVYSMAIGLTSWLAIELGRWWLGGTDDIPWPVGWRGIALVVCGIGAGFVLGSAIGDAYSGSTQGLLQRHDAVSTLVITVVASTAISFFFYSRGKSAHLQARMAQAQRDATEARLKLLEAQLEPHMMFNTLANLRALIATDPPRAIDMLDRLNQYLRATLKASRTDASSGDHTLANEFARLRDYLELMAVRMGARLRHQLILPDELKGQALPPLLLQPLVENAIRHGLEPQVAGGALVVRARREAHHLVLEVQDSGAGMNPHAPAGFGLTQVRERLHSTHGAAATLTLAEAPGGGTLARIHLPLRT